MVFFHATFSSPRTSFAVIGVLSGFGDDSQCPNTALTLFLSYLACKTEPLSARIANAVIFASEGIYSRHLEDSGCYLAAVAVGTDGAFCVNVGNCRVYSKAPRKKMRMVSADDTLFGLAQRGNQADVMFNGGHLPTQYLGSPFGIKANMRCVDGDEEGVFLLASESVFLAAEPVLPDVASMREQASSLFGGDGSKCLALLQTPLSGLLPPGGQAVSKLTVRMPGTVFRVAR